MGYDISPLVNIWKGWLQNGGLINGGIGPVLGRDGLQVISSIDVLGPENMGNEGFELDHNLQWWVKLPEDGLLEETGAPLEVHTGLIAAKLTGGAVSPSIVRISQDNPTTPGNEYVMSFWARGDGVNGGAYYMFDRISGNDIIPRTDTGITGIFYQQVSVKFTAPVGCTNVRTIFYAPSADGGFMCVDDTSFREVLPGEFSAECTAAGYPGNALITGYHDHGLSVTLDQLNYTITLLYTGNELVPCELQDFGGYFLPTFHFTDVFTDPDIPSVFNTWEDSGYFISDETGEQITDPLVVFHPDETITLSWGMVNDPTGRGFTLYQESPANSGLWVNIGQFIDGFLRSIDYGPDSSYITSRFGITADRVGYNGMITPSLMQIFVPYVPPVVTDERTANMRNEAHFRR
jgi:hypothetical protein